MFFVCWPKKRFIESPHHIHPHTPLTRTPKLPHNPSAVATDACLYEFSLFLWVTLVVKTEPALDSHLRRFWAKKIYKCWQELISSWSYICEIRDGCGAEEVIIPNFSRKTFCRLLMRLNKYEFVLDVSIFKNNNEHVTWCSLPVQIQILAWYLLMCHMIQCIVIPHSRLNRLTPSIVP